jgi:hypothetical protein
LCRANKEVAVNCGWIDGRVRVSAGNIIMMSGLPFINLLVVTLRAAWFNFRGWKKRP